MGRYLYLSPNGMLSEFYVSYTHTGIHTPNMLLCPCPFRYPSVETPLSPFKVSLQLTAHSDAPNLRLTLLSVCVDAGNWRAKTLRSEAEQGLNCRTFLNLVRSAVFKKQGDCQIDIQKTSSEEEPIVTFSGLGWGSIEVSTIVSGYMASRDLREMQNRLLSNADSGTLSIIAASIAGLMLRVIPSLTETAT
jgi:hypothetical protein